MTIFSPSKLVHNFKLKNSSASINDVLIRDQEQSELLHQPKTRIYDTDPMTGHDIDDYKTHPSLVDGNLTIFFENNATRKAYIDMPVNHPSLSVPFEASNEDDRGG